MNSRLRIAAASAVGLLAATGGIVGAADASTTPPAGSTESGPLVIEHRYGSTEVDGVPERIVSLDAQWTDVLGALDAPVVGALFNPYGADRFPWQTDILPDVETVVATTGGGLPYEAIAALDPDLIVVSWEATDEAAYDQLTAIAPTIPLLDDAGVGRWQDMAEVAGRVLDRPDDAAELIATAEQLSADVLAELPGLEGKTYALANYLAGDSIWIVADPDDGAGVFFSQLGMQIAPQLLELPNLDQGRAPISTEQIDLLDSDLLIMLTNGTPTGDIAGYDALRPVQSGAVVLLDVADVSALNTPSPLSIAYVLELIRPALEIAAG